MSRCLLVLAALLAGACAVEDVTAAARTLEPALELAPSADNPLSFRAQTVDQGQRNGPGMYLPTSFLIPGGEGKGPWGEWGAVSPCSRTCGGGVASQKRICLHNGPEGQSLCTGGDTKYFSCQTQDCPEGSADFRAEQCAEFNDKSFSGHKYNWVPYTFGENPCELDCMPFFKRYKLQVTDGTRCSEDSFDVCVNGKCQPVGCDRMLNSTAREDKCRECRGNGANCRTTEGIIDSKDLVTGYNDILLIPAGATSINIDVIIPSNNYFALRSKNGTYYLNGNYQIFPRRIRIAGALWTYERSQQGYVAPDRLRCLGPTTEPLYLSLLFQDQNVGIRYEFSVPNDSAPPTDKRYNWVHEEFAPCSATCDGGFQTRNVTCRSTEELEIVRDSLCNEGLRPPTNQSCSPEPCPVQWVEGPWGECSQRCGSRGVRSREVICQKIANGIKSIVPDNECFDRLGLKPEVFQKCNEDSPCPTWFVGHWKPCDKLCDEGKQTRQVVCYQKKDGRIEVLDDKDCTEEKPEVEQPCMLQICEEVDWAVSNWTGCDSCTSKFRTRVVVCSTIGRQVVDDSFCSYHQRPVDIEECDKGTLPACALQWFAMQWSKCSVTCGDGVQTRKVFCGMYYDNASGEGVEIVDDAKCANLTKYKDTKPCTVPKEECPSQWFAGPWTQCTKKCGGGEKFRRVMCFRGDKEATDCDAFTVLDSTDFCNTGLCEPDLDVLVPADVDYEEVGTNQTSEQQDRLAPRTNSNGVTKKVRESNCRETKFGCCPDKTTAALGPFDAGCLKVPRTCKESSYGCCPDGLSPAQGENNEGCPVEPCADTLFGCCDSDNKTAAQGNDQEGCPPPPPPCASSEYGCCADNEIEAIGPDKQGCPETETSTTAALTETTAETTESSETSEGSTTESSETSEGSTTNEGATDVISTTTVDLCSGFEFGCCADNETEVLGPDGQGCPCNTTEFGCCPDGTSPASGLNNEGCPGSCSTTPHGCCQDGKTPAHGPEFEGCCLLQAFGCCPDNRKPAEGPRFEGCGCQNALHGCCPDNDTVALGPDNLGCGCQYTQHGCCPDRLTVASGPNNEGCACNTRQFGCCPDGVTIAQGPDQQGCHCRDSKFGCCGDGETPATGNDAAGCDCSSSRHGCCPDGQTEAAGPKFLGCTDAPENKQAACSMSEDPGPCHNFTAMWYYDLAYGACSRFWYGGCNGNGNRFATKEECEDVCVQPSPKDACKLPSVKGACDVDYQRWHYNSTREQCIPFRYGGCLGNANNFDSRELCQKQCEPSSVTVQCDLPIDQGTCAGNFSRWGFNSEAHRCEQFIWGGCEGNSNRFSSEAACQLRCAGTQPPQCTQLQEAGNCTEKEALWSFSQSEGRCLPFYYSGCGGNDNRFGSREACEQTCPSAYARTGGGRRF